MRRGARSAGLLALGVFAACERGPETTIRDALDDGTFLTLGGDPVTLSGGVGVAGNVRHELVMAVEGDLDFDGETDAAAVLVAAEGRERLFTLHALLPEDGAAEDVSARLIGDRIEVRGMAIDEGLIRIDATIRRPRDPVTATPSVNIARYFALTRRGVIPIRLTEVHEDGTAGEAGARTASGETPATPALYTHEWMLESFDAGDWTADLGRLDEPVSLRFLSEAFEGSDVSGQVSGFAGCNQVYGSFRTRQLASLRFYGLTTTRRRCGARVAEVEQRLYDALTSVRAFQLSGDRLVLALAGGAIRFRAGGRLSPADGEAVETQSGDAGLPSG